MRSSCVGDSRLPTIKQAVMYFALFDSCLLDSLWLLFRCCLCSHCCGLLLVCVCESVCACVCVFELLLFFLLFPLLLLLLLMVIMNLLVAAVIYVLVSWLASLLFPRREAGDVWCLPPVWNLRAVVWFHFTVSSLVLLPNPVTVSVLFLFCFLVCFSAYWRTLLTFCFTRNFFNIFR